MKTTIKALDNFDALKAGHIYSVCAKCGTRMIAFTDHVGGALVSLYDWQVKDGTLRGKLIYVDEVQSAAMSCTTVSQLCHSLPSKYIY